MLRRNLSLALLASGTGAALVAKETQAQTCTAPCYALTAAETAAGVTAANSNQAYLPGDVRRYKADPSGATSSTAAINLGIATGYSLYFCDGTFLTSGNHAPEKNTEWWGTGTLKGSGTANPLVTIGAISNYTFAINTDCSLQSASGPKYAITASGTTNFSIQDGRHLQGAIAIGTATGCSNFSISNNDLLQTAVTQQTTTGAIDLNAQCTDFEITNNRISQSQGPGISVYNRATQGVIANNSCTGCVVGSGIVINSATYLTIEGNICNNNGQCGIELSAASNANTYGWVSYCTVTGNICGGNSQDGIDYNLAYQTGTPVPLATFTTISSNILSNNGIVAKAGTGVNLEYVAECTVSGNTVVGNYGSGIELNNTTYCTVSGNSVIASGAQAPANSADGISISGTFNTVTGNTSTNNGGGATQRYGIYEGLGSNYNIISGNNLNNNATAPLYIVGSNSIVQGNMPISFDKMQNNYVFSSYTTPTPPPGTTTILNASLWMNPTNGTLYVLQAGTWTAK